MSEVPKIVYDRLRAAQLRQAFPDDATPKPAHPDADLLTAFAEQSLTATERDGVLAHLALCDDCREVASLALPAADLVPTPITSQAAAEDPQATISRTSARHRPVFAWPSLRWAALAAAVVVVASVLVVHPARWNHAALSKAVPQVAVTAAPDSIQPSASAGSQSVNPPATSAPTEEAKVIYAVPSPKKLKAEKAQSLPIQGRSVMAFAQNQSAPHRSADAKAAPAPSMGRSSEAVEVSTEQAATAATPSVDGTLMARNDALPIEKAKQAPQETGANALQTDEAQKSAAQKTVAAASAASSAANGRNMTSLATLTTASPTITPTATWTITAGVLQRSLDGGQSWQNASHSDHPLLCYASHSDDVWAGGQAGALLHSIDSGITWEQVRPSVKAQALTSDITHIDLHGPAEIVVSTSNNEVWVSADAGKTWAKK